MSDSSQQGSGGMIKRLSEAGWVEPVLGALVAVYGILTAATAYTASIYGGNSAENYFVALSDLTDAASEYQASDVIYTADANGIIQTSLQELAGASPEAIEIVQSDMSELGLAALDRSGELDDQYMTELYDWPDRVSENSDSAFVAAQEWDALGDNYEFLVLLLAVGLGFGAWASLIGKESVVRYMFGVLAVIMLVASLIYGMGLIGTPRPESIQSIYDTEGAPDPIE